MRARQQIASIVNSGWYPEDFMRARADEVSKWQTQTRTAEGHIFHSIREVSRFVGYHGSRLVVSYELNAEQRSSHASIPSRLPAKMP
jgi:hypothetical protein